MKIDFYVNIFKVQIVFYELLFELNLNSTK